MIFPSFGISKRKRHALKESDRRKRRQAFRQTQRMTSRKMELESLEDRMVLTSYLFIEYGDNFPSGTLSTTQGDFRDVADSAVPAEKILGTPLADSSGFNAGTDLDIVAQTFTADERARMFDVVQRAYEAVDVTVVELTSSSQTLADGRTVSAAANMTDVIDNLRGGDAAAKDAYVFVATFIADPGGPNQMTYGPGGGGLSPSNTLGVTSDLNAAANVHDDVAVVYSDGGFSFNTTNNISHEAGHLFGMRHGITTALTSPPVANANSINLLHQAEIMSYRNTNNTSSSTFMRYPSIRGDGNTSGGDLINYDDIAPRAGQVTNYDQMANDAGIGANPNHHFVSGTGLHDVITLTANGANVDVTVQAFTDNTYTTALKVPGQPGTTFSYSIPANNTILVHGGDSDDRIVINGDLGVDVDIDGMRGSDSLVIDGMGASMASYTPDATSTTGVDLNAFGTRLASFGGSIMVGASTITYDNYELTSEVTIEDFGTVEFVTPGSGADELTASVIAGVPRLTGTVDGGNPIAPFEIQQTGGEFIVTTGAGSDMLTVDFGAGNPVPAGELTYNAGGNAGDEMVLNNGAFNTVRHFLDNSADGRVEVDADNTDNGGAAERLIHYTGLAPIADNLNVVNREFDFGAGNDQDVVVRDNGLPVDGLNVIEAPSNAETVTFTNPTNSLTVDLGSGDDIIDVQTLDNGFAATVIVDAGTGSDEVTIAPSPVVPFLLDGEAQTDTLNVDVGNAPVTLSDGLIDIAGLQPIGHANFEAINLENMLDLTVQGSGVNDELIVTGGDSGLHTASFTLDMTVNGVGTGPVYNVDPTSLTFNGADGDDALLVNDADGLPTFTGSATGAFAHQSFIDDTGLGAADIGLHFNGGANATVDGDVIGMDLSSANQTVRYYSGSTGASNSGNLSVDGELALSFTGLEPIDLLGAGAGSNLIVDATSSPATANLTIDDDAALPGPWGGLFGAAAIGDGVSGIQGDGGFENTRFANFGSLRLRGGDGSETIILDGIDMALGNPLNALSLDGDNTTLTDPAADVISINALPAAVTATVFGGAGNDLITIGAGSLDPVQGPITVFGEADDPLPTASFDANAKGQNVNVTLPIGDRLLIDDGIDATANNTYLINDGGFNRNAGAGVGIVGIESLDVITSSTPTTDVNVLDTTAAAITQVFANGATDVDVTTTGAGSALLIDGSFGNDNVFVDTTGANSVVVVNGGGGADDITLNDSGSDSGVVLQGGSSGDILIVEATGDNSVTEVRGGTGDDVISVVTTGAGSFLEAFGEGNDDSAVFGAGFFTLDGILGMVGFVGGAGDDDLVVQDQTDTDDNNYIIEPTMVTRNAGTPIVMYDGTTEELFVFGGTGNDKFVAAPSPDTEYFLDGGAPSTGYGSIPGDVFSVNPIGTSILTADADQSDGAVTFSGGYETVNFADFEWVVLPDRFENNDYANGFSTGGFAVNPTPDNANLATVLGSLPEITLRDLSIHGPDDPATAPVEDTDFFEYTAHSTGSLIVNALFEHEYGDLELRIYDEDGDVITPSVYVPSTDANDGEQILIPVVSQAVYYIEVVGAAAVAGECNVNNYALEIENFPAAQPEVDLVDASDSGVKNDDDITNDNTPTIAVQADLLTLAGIAIDQGIGITGVDLTVRAVNQATGAATVVEGSAVGGVWTATFPVLADGEYFIDAWLVVTDGSTPVNIGRGPFSEPLTITIDTVAPAAPAGLDLQASSDSGLLDNDELTNKMALAIAGDAEANSQVFLTSNGASAVGTGLVNPAGEWEITTEPLDHGTHQLTAVAQDLAGNVSGDSATLTVEVDTLAPQRPTIDLVNADDSGSSEFDNITTGEAGANGVADFRIQGVPGERLRIKDGDIPIQLAAGVTYPVPPAFDAVTGDPIIPASGELFVRIDFITLAGVTGYAAEGPHPLSTELYDIAGNRGAQAEELLVEIDYTAPVAPTVALAAASDSGVLGDGITSINQPLFVGTGEANSKIHLIDTETGDVIASGVVQSDESDLDPANGLGVWELTVETLANDDYMLVAASEDVAGNFSAFGNVTVVIDPHEPNDTIVNATVLGSETEVTLNEQVIHNDADVDIYEYTAHDTGKMIINLAHRLGAVADLNLRVLDASGAVLATAAAVGDETLIIPVVGQGSYYVEVAPSVAGVDRTLYDLEIENFAAPVPTNVTLDPNDDSGMSNTDMKTFVEDAQFFIQSDLFDFGLMGINVLSADDAYNLSIGNLGGAVETSGAAVELYINGSSVGFAEPVFGTTTLFAIELDELADLVAETGEFDDVNIPIGPDAGAIPADAMGYLQLISAATRIFDGALDGGGNPINARTQLSPLKVVHFDNVEPTIAPVTIDLVTSSDSGKLDDPGTFFDNVTNKMSPAFAGLAEENTRVTLWAELLDPDTLLPIGDFSAVGIGTVQSDASDGVIGDGLGRWEITSEPLQDGLYNIYLQQEDMAGNMSDYAEAEFMLTIDTASPHRPTVDLVGPDVADDLFDMTNDPAVPVFVAPIYSDTGMSTFDGITRGFAPVLAADQQGSTQVQLRISAEPGSWVKILDGEDIIGSFMMPVGLPTPPDEQEIGNFVFYTIPLDEDPHPISVVAMDSAGNLSHQSFELVVTVDTTAPLGAANKDLNSSADSGAFDDDNITNINAPSFTGVAEANSMVTIRAVNKITGEVSIVGTAFAGSDESDGTEGDQLGAWEITVEPLDDGAYNIYADVEDKAGNITEDDDPLMIAIDTIAPNLPFLDLQEDFDTGRHDDDNITNLTDLDFNLTSHDDNLDFLNQILMLADPDDIDNLQFRIWDRIAEDVNNGLFEETLVFDSGLQDLEALTTTLALNENWHDLKLEVIDRAGNYSHDFLLDVIVDTTAPEVNIMTISPNDDSGLDWMPATYGDNITNVTNPEFIGQAEDNTIVRLYADSTANNAIDDPANFFLTVALPYDGDEADGAADGQWEAKFKYNLNHPTFFPALDGLREILVTAEDVAGNTSTPAANDILDIFVDTQGPRVYDPAGAEGAVYFPVDPDYDVFDPKPSVDGPTPVVNEIRINVEDLPERDAAFLYDAIKSMNVNVNLPDGSVAQMLPEGSVDLVGDYNGNIPIASVSWLADPLAAGSVATGEIVLLFDAPVPDDRFTLTVHDSLTDPAGNALDGEFDTDEPQDDHVLPTGDKVPGGNFVARFTVDTRPEIGVWAAGNIWVDTNGNTVWDPDNPDFVHRDIAYAMGFTTDDIFAGNFSNIGAVTADGFDKIAAYGSFNGQFRWLIDIDNDGMVDLDIDEPSNVNGLPIAGDFDLNAANGDEVGIFDGNSWWFDTDHDYEVDTQLPSTMNGYPIIGDFDGDGNYDLGTWADDTFMLDVSTEGGGITGNADYTFRFGFVGSRERPVAHDFNMDGYDDLGLWAPDRTGTTPGEGSEWYLLVSGDVQGLDPALDQDGDGVLNGVDPDADNDGITDATLMERIRSDVRLGVDVIDYKPSPFGNDLYFQYGDNFALPLVGNFDPPVSPSEVENPYAGGNMHFNPNNVFDVNNDGVVTLADMRLIFIDLSENGGRRLLGAAQSELYLDVNRDGYLSLSDLRAEFAYLVGTVQAEGEAEGEFGSAGLNRSTDANFTVVPHGEHSKVSREVEDLADWASNADAVFSEREDLSESSTIDEVVGAIAEDLLDLI